MDFVRFDVKPFIEVDTTHEPHVHNETVTFVVPVADAGRILDWIVNLPLVGSVTCTQTLGPDNAVGRLSTVPFIAEPDVDDIRRRCVW